MSFAIIRNQKYKMSQLNNVYRHNERKNENYSNKDIDKSKTETNYHLKKPLGSYEAEFERLKNENNLMGNLRLEGKKQSNVVCEFLATSDSQFFDSLGEAGTKRYFQSVYDFACKKCGKENIISAVVHLDETTPHMHLTYIPVVEGQKKGEAIKKINCSEFWKGFNSYGVLQDNFHEFVTQKGFQLQRGESCEVSREHLSVKEFKISTKREEIKQKMTAIHAAEQDIEKQEINIENKKRNIDSVEHAINEVVEDVQALQNKLEDINTIKTSKTILGSKIAISEYDYKKLQGIAKLGVALQGVDSKYQRLKTDYKKLEEQAKAILKQRDGYAEKLNTVTAGNDKLEKNFKILENFINKRGLRDELLEEMEASRKEALKMQQKQSHGWSR